MAAMSAMPSSLPLCLWSPNAVAGAIIPMEGWFAVIHSISRNLKLSTSASLPSSVISLYRRRNISMDPESTVQRGQNGADPNGTRNISSRSHGRGPPAGTPATPRIPLRVSPLLPLKTTRGGKTFDMDSLTLDTRTHLVGLSKYGHNRLSLSHKHRLSLPDYIPSIAPMVLQQFDMMGSGLDSMRHHQLPRIGYDTWVAGGAQRVLGTAQNW
ncbi:hypothetical protein FN846DRAFT_894735 [Sphaerosporella brunnea]|uniref:Uncharacterized protein n=1 Tax=Sphaerosporella brunnea TaxID=1250544 RepID=A0A5J5EII2_9PEZI|nr:hypothetical protein FN846DRAFT_894735 [Sphaerosporella brunnea]